MADDVQAVEGAPHDGLHEQAGDARAPEIDIARLAEKVYVLMREELRLERARGATRMRSR
jgi:hypothetical protein